MSDAEDVLISVRPQYVRRLLAGSKSVELRRRAPRLAAGTRVWVYTKSPEAKVEALAILDRVEVKPLSEMWAAFGSQIDIQIDEFHKYLRGVERPAAMVFSKILPLESAVTLDEIRRISAEFHPPQFYARLPSLDALVKRFKEEVS